jgi:TetR/AcrR family transcriptional regulator, regulator of cefoperazone and chloramphenicol sensitivity
MPNRTRPRPKPRADEKATRDHLLDVASEVFAEHGFDRATGKEITRRAGANVAAINYHFGGIDGLYAAVIKDAHDRLVTVEELSAAVDGTSDPKAKFAAVMHLFARAITGPAASSRYFRVLGREILAPSPALKKLDEQLRLPKARIVKKLVSDLLALPESHPAVARACISVMAPCLMMLIADPISVKRIFPNFKLTAKDADALGDHLATFALAGLAAVTPKRT